MVQMRREYDVFTLQAPVRSGINRSDVLRFELEWLGFDRKKTAKMELRDGFKGAKL